MNLRKSTLFKGKDMNSNGNDVSPPKSGRVRWYCVSDGSCKLEGTFNGGKDSMEDGVNDGQKWHERWYGYNKCV